MNRCRPIMFAPLAAVLLLGYSDTAFAQPQLVVTPATTPSAPLTFNPVPSGGISASQTIMVSDTANTQSTVIIQPSATWIVVTPSSGTVNIPAQLSIQCNTSTLSVGTYNGYITISVDGAPTDQVTVYISLTVSGVSQLSANPSTIDFTAEEGASVGSPASTQVQILSSGGPLNYTLQATTSSNSGNWLLLSTTSGNTSGPPFTVSVNPSALMPTAFPATYYGVITAASTTTSDTVIINVQLTLTSTAEINVTPSSLAPFLFQYGTTIDPQPQTLSVTSTGGAIAFTVQANPQVSWLVISPLGATAGGTPPANITLSVNPVEQALQPGTYTTNLIITPTGGTALPAIPVTLVVAQHPLIQLSGPTLTGNSLSFTAPFAGSAPPTQSLTVTASGGANVPFSVTSNQPWLTATTSAATTPASLVVQVNPTALTVQSYSGTLTIKPLNGDTYTETINVSLNVSASIQITAAPPVLLFSYEIGQTPPNTQNVQVQSNGQPVQFNIVISTSNCGSNWLGATTNSVFTNATVSISVSTTGLTSAATCSGTVNLNYNNGLGQTTLPINVTLAVSATPELVVQMAPGFGIQSAPLAGPESQQQISLTSTDPNNQVPFTASIINAPGGWLGITGNSSGSTPQNLNLVYDPAAEANPGVYSGNLLITSPSLPSSGFSIPITLTLTTTTTVTVTPASLTFSENQGGPAPAAQTLTVASTPGLASFSAAVSNVTGGVNWLQISPASGGTNSTVQVSINANTLSQGTYTADISFTFTGAATQSTTVPVTLNVLAPQSISVSPTSLSFSYQIAGTAPASQPLSITSSNGSATVAVSVASGASWLSIDNKGGTTPQTVNVSVNPAGLTAQTYTGSISISSSGVLATPITVPVTFTVSAQAAPQPTTIFNNASQLAGVVAPGEEIDIKGSLLGPANAANGGLFTVNSSGGVNPTLDGVSVTFNNNPGTVLYVSPTQIDVMVPYEINGQLSTTMVVSYNGVASTGVQLGVAQAAPALFTNNSTGSGQVAALNQNGTYNGFGSGLSAAPRGSVVQLFGTGGGQTTPASITGSVTPVPANASGLLQVPNVTATVGGIPATVEFAGAAPGLVTGVLQVNVVVPNGVTPGAAVPVTITVNGVTSPMGATIAVD